ncbi:hypothetical protein BJ138DRAFT_1146758 [Hygrophoropsis aurantiaca]|uniref:Uncharacterized protein n=1 Tax=Hygrophoropsis aurantiaca TaxID=72124 RepID=A0ACB8AKA3_9AGAM|nr:hypothetical protein BJ138DRAFT_1146758 [Hygrophoropsis aurantiaca]
MYRISANWKNGRCAIDNLNDTADSSSESQSVAPIEHTHILLTRQYVITASSNPSSLPRLLVRNKGDSNIIQTITCKPSLPHVTASISALALDQCRPSSAEADQHVRIAVFLSTGEFNIFELAHSSSSIPSIPKFTYAPRSASARHRTSSASVTHAAFHHPLLVTLSDTFTVSIYDLNDGIITRTQTLSSFTSYPPTSLVLSAMSESVTYKLVLAYAVPVYPAHWSVGATELIISRSGASESSHPFDSLPNFALGPMAVIKTRTARAVDTPPGFIDERKLLLMRAQWDRKVKKIADTQTDGKWVVLAAGDPLTASTNATSTAPSSAPPTPSFISSASHSSAHLQLYRLQMPSSAHAPKLTFVRTLRGPLGATVALSLADGRCVSLSANGSIWVWDLDGGEGAEVANPVALDAMDARTTDVKGTVTFDERRIVSAGVRGVEVRRFDI